MAVFSCSFLLKYAAIAAFQNACFSSWVIAWNTLYFIGSVLSVPLLHSYYTIWFYIFQLAHLTNIELYIYSFFIWNYIKIPGIILKAEGDKMPTQAQREANKRLPAKLERVSFWVPKDGTKERITAFAKAQGISVNAYILGLIEKDMQEAERPKD